MTLRAQILFLIFACCAVFYPAFSADICSIDDLQLFQSLNHSTSNLLDIFTRTGSSTLYYRPMLGVTFWIDRNIFQISPFWMHLENILIHLFSIFLIFFIARLLFIKKNYKSNIFPLFTALIWGLHPLTTESVSWISGRTDLLAGMFIFSATFFILQYRKSKNNWYILLAGVMSLLAMLSKEVAVAFIPGAVLIFFALPTIRLLKLGITNKIGLFLTTVGTAIPLAFFFFIRSVATTSNSSRIGLTIQYIDNNPIHSLMLFCRALSFYVKKIFIPLPLNFAIVDIDPIYDLFAIPIILFCVWLLWNRSVLAAFFLTGIILLTPSFLIVLNQIAWTPFAERYVYISMAFIIISIMGFISEHLPERSHPLSLFVLIPLTFFLAFSTYQRNTVWQSDFKLIEDTAIKSPKAKKVQMVYGAKLSQQNKLEKALLVTKRACALSQSPLIKDYTIDTNLGFIYINLKRYKEALLTFKQILKRNQKPYAPAQEGLFITYMEIAKDTTPPENIQSYKEAKKAATLLFNQTKDPFVWYRLGKLSLRLQEKEQAKMYFNKAYEAFPDSSPYKEFSKKLSLK